MNYSEQKQIPGVPRSTDFEKTFDSISWEFILNTLKLFNLGNSIINWIKKMHHPKSYHFSVYLSTERMQAGLYLYALCRNKGKSDKEQQKYREYNNRGGGIQNFLIRR